MPPSHAWEVPHVSVRQHAWECEGIKDDADSSGPEDDPEHNPIPASREFLAELVDLYLVSSISAKTLCVLCYWAQKAGMQGDLVEEYAMKPGCSTGNYQKHLDKKMGFNTAKSKFHSLKIPGFSLGCVSRVLRDSEQTVYC